MRHLVLMELASLIFLITSTYLVMGSLPEQAIEIIVMYAIFSSGMLLYIRPSYHNKKNKLERRSTDQ